MDVGMAGAHRSWTRRHRQTRSTCSQQDIERQDIKGSGGAIAIRIDSRLLEEVTGTKFVNDWLLRMRDMITDKNTSQVDMFKKEKRVVQLYFANEWNQRGKIEEMGGYSLHPSLLWTRQHEILVARYDEIEANPHLNSFHTFGGISKLYMWIVPPNQTVYSVHVE
ncbi:hypothetical protein NEOLEDRAFT_1152484 [Neolentinus lepideus HHB14362 ss-1]|uniref:Uncharacterized protein n=1 Tax=Neolentinus lepideus HHB14362 ss-1 TaxID=1314782 RepID=A0A165MQG5_9AGAM|nr:hypothetical protein NEOLEDRAFT_1152484 [Neolentinus lepideus HHB14362 ss-1]